jgi:hypothetical protein
MWLPSFSKEQGPMSLSSLQGPMGRRIRLQNTLEDLISYSFSLLASNAEEKRTSFLLGLPRRIRMLKTLGD